MPQRASNLQVGYTRRPTLPQVDAALARARVALKAGCEQGDLDGVYLALAVLDQLLDTRREVTHPKDTPCAAS